ncbi:hypothetical protein OF83DRAFT_1141841 [Amylostereum chailletii]|nr:hypothetical protein OF83DRAFT_1141841 [Amylostereum chailletii]
MPLSGLCRPYGRFFIFTKLDFARTPPSPPDRTAKPLAFRRLPALVLYIVSPADKISGCKCRGKQEGGRDSRTRPGRWESESLHRRLTAALFRAMAISPNTEVYASGSAGASLAGIHRHASTPVLPYLTTLKFIYPHRTHCHERSPLSSGSPCKYEGMKYDTSCLRIRRRRPRDPDRRATVSPEAEGTRGDAGEPRGRHHTTTGVQRGLQRVQSRLDPSPRRQWNEAPSLDCLCRIQRLYT